MSKQYDIETLLDGIVTLPSLPEVVECVNGMVDDPNCSIGEVGKVIATDPAIALKTLRLVNSAYYGLRNRITSVEHAVTLLGAKVIKNLVLSATVFDTFKTSTDNMLCHSVACGTAMGILAQKRRPPLPIEPEEAFVFGLLHDIGQIIIEEFLPEEHAEVQALCRAKHLPSHEAERLILGIDHAEFGARLAAKWKLPPGLIDGIAGHHDLTKCSDPALQEFAAVLNVADYICAASGLPSTDTGTSIVDPVAWSLAGFTSEELPDILEAFFEALAGLDELISIASSGEE